MIGRLRHDAFYDAPRYDEPSAAAPRRQVARLERKEGQEPPATLLAAGAARMDREVVSGDRAVVIKGLPWNVTEAMVRRIAQVRRRTTGNT